MHADEKLSICGGTSDMEDVARSSVKTVARSSVKKKATPADRRSGHDRRSAQDRREMPRPEGRRTNGGRRATDSQDV